MSPEIAELLESMTGAVITRSVAANGNARIVAVSDLYTFAIVLEGCNWDDERCENCTCDKERFALRVERVP